MDQVYANSFCLVGWGFVRASLGKLAHHREQSTRCKWIDGTPYGYVKRIVEMRTLAVGIQFDGMLVEFSHHDESMGMKPRLPCELINYSPPKENAQEIWPTVCHTGCG